LPTSQKVFGSGPERCWWYQLRALIPTAEESRPLSKTTILASGQITPTDALLVELREPDEFPASILITWPQMPSVVDPRRFGATANAVAWLMATAITNLAEIRALE
jgi:hypothetical protein